MKYNAHIAALAAQMPARVRRLPISDEGWPVPWGPNHGTLKAFQRNLCWCCGEALGKTGFFGLEPVDTISRHSRSGPLHFDCLNFCIIALAHPHRVLWGTRSWEIVRNGEDYLFAIDEPLMVRFFVDGRPATSEEATAAILDVSRLTDDQRAIQAALALVR